MVSSVSSSATRQKSRLNSTGSKLLKAARFLDGSVPGLEDAAGPVPGGVEGGQLSQCCCSASVNGDTSVKCTASYRSSPCRPSPA